MRYLIAVLCLIGAVAGCSHTPPDYVSRYTTPISPEPQAPAALAIIGDSYTGGSATGGKELMGWPALVADRLDQQGIPIDPAVGFEAGSGYVQPGEDGHVFADQIPNVVGSTDQLVVLFGSRNDAAVPANQLTAAVRRTLADVRTAAPAAKILVIGPAWMNTAPPPGIQQVRNVLKTEASASGATFVDPIADGWFVGQSILISSYSKDPTDAGHSYLADEITPLIAKQLQPTP
ncbi:SGNH/GDSL hydrolase family protein [Mycobacterium sp. CVI_P3]|uniref:SGNH/GDSL hydrolase family protein n=1 Tax=Mycobacterium pinniadriaticum TaxID=2994102 RepID=A0ABT3SK32_9MYCO|nr:SGNH/GDSL hydrolase family protein [Mycobacterium pinniadriaticum]MCX2932811.1 SGNH/GDSL hydrolase family protein [Mycobacterium pinniadriaticum]MCX2939235.1 SGNH/GDSL hydrolase family protein [Mycobacterium pinniadriaticum]